jgi:hypothetical protein
VAWWAALPRDVALRGLRQRGMCPRTCRTSTE